MVTRKPHDNKPLSGLKFLEDLSNSNSLYESIFFTPSKEEQRSHEQDLFQTITNEIQRAPKFYFPCQYMNAAIVTTSSQCRLTTIIPSLSNLLHKNVLGMSLGCIFYVR